MADDEGQGRVLDLPLVRLFAPPEARPPEDLTPAATAQDGYPALTPIPAAEPPESLTLPAALDPAGDDSPVTTMVNRAVDPGASRARSGAATAMVVAAAVAVACLRGTFAAVEYVRARAEHHRAVKSKTRPDTKTTGARVPSGPEYGRAAVRHGRGPKSKGTFGADGLTRPRHAPAGSGGFKSLKEARKKAKKDAAARKKRRTDKQAGKDGARSKSRSTSADTKQPKLKPKKEKKRKGSGGGGRTTLPQALQEKADRRLKRRRKELQPAIGKDKKRKSKEKKSKKGSGAPKSPQVDPTKTSDGAGRKTKKSRKGKAGWTHAPGGRPGARPWRGRGRQSGGRGRWRWTWRRPRADKSGQEHVRDTPNPDGEWLRPPPGWRVTTSYTVTQDGPPRRHAWPEQGAVTTGPRPGTSAPRRTAAPTSARPAQGGSVTAPVRTTQYTDSDLTVHDVIDSDADMAEEILAGAEHTQAVAGQCEQLASSLEALRAELIAKKVPGVLIGWTARLIERAGVVQDKAERLAAGLPRASEAIGAAGQRAADADKHRVDAVRDAGHVAPAEREYHQE